MAETKLVQGDSGLVPAGEGWFVVNVRDAQWRDSDDFGADCFFEGPNVEFGHLGTSASCTPASPTASTTAEIVYPVSEVAKRHGAGVEVETPLPAEAYASYPPPRFERPAGWETLPWA